MHFVLFDLVLQVTIHTNLQSSLENWFPHGIVKILYMAILYQILTCTALHIPVNKKNCATVFSRRKVKVVAFNGLCAQLQSEWSGFKPSCLGTLCCVLGQDTLLLKCLSPPRSTIRYQQT